MPEQQTPMKSGAEAHWSQLRSAHQLRVLLSDVQRKAREEELRIGRATLRAKQLEELLAERKRAAMPKMTAANRAKLQALGLNHVFSTRALTSALAEREADAQRAESAAARKERLQLNFSARALVEQRETAAGDEPREGGEEQPELSAEQQAEQQKELEAEAQHQREAYVAELEKLIEEDKLADAEREQLIADLRAAHLEQLAELDAVRDDSAAQVSSLRRRLAQATATQTAMAASKAALECKLAAALAPGEEALAQLMETSPSGRARQRFEAASQHEEGEDGARKAWEAELMQALKDEREADEGRAEGIASLRAAYEAAVEEREAARLRSDEWMLKARRALDSDKNWREMATLQELMND